jgi:hypothetical protein
MFGELINNNNNTQKFIYRNSYNFGGGGGGGGGGGKVRGSVRYLFSCGLYSYRETSFETS